MQRHEAEDTCCICLSGKECGAFVKACKCSGTTLYHEECIKEFIVNKKNFTCPNCKSDYNGKFVEDLKAFATGYMLDMRRNGGLDQGSNNSNMIEVEVQVKKRRLIYLVLFIATLAAIGVRSWGFILFFMVTTSFCCISIR